MGYLGNKPTAVPIQSSDLQDNIITSAKIVDGTIVNADVNDLAATKLTGSIADARVPASAVTQHVTATDLTPVRHDILTLGLKQAVQENSTKFNLTNSAIVKFEADADFNLAGSTTVGRNASEYISTNTLAAFAGDAESINMGGYQSSATPNGTAITIGTGAEAGVLDISGWTINSESTPNIQDVYGCVIDLGATVTLASPLRWHPRSKRYKSTGGGSNDYNAGIIEINFGTSATGGWQFGSGGITPTLTATGDWTVWGTGADKIHDQVFASTGAGYYHSSASSSTNFPDDFLQYSWTSGTATGRYLLVSMNPTNGVFNGFKMSDANGDFCTTSTTTNATGTALGTTNVPSSAVTDVSGVMLLKNAYGTNTLGTDVKVYFTADNSAWTEVTDYADAGTFSTGIKMIKLGKKTCTSGSDVRWKIVWANQANASKEGHIYGIGLNY